MFTLPATSPWAGFPMKTTDDPEAEAPDSIFALLVYINLSTPAPEVFAVAEGSPAIFPVTSMVPPCATSSSIGLLVDPPDRVSTALGLMTPSPEVTIVVTFTPSPAETSNTLFAELFPLMFEAPMFTLPLPATSKVDTPVRLAPGAMVTAPLFVGVEPLMSMTLLDSKVSSSGR